MLRPTPLKPADPDPTSRPNSRPARRPRPRVALLGLALAALFAAGCAADRAPPPRESSVSPDINAPYLRGVDVDEWIERFEAAGREIFDLRDAIIVAAGIEPDMDVADVGAGTGLLTVLMAERVGPGGSVVAVDIVPEFVHHIRRRADAQGLHNVHPHLGSERSVKLPTNSVDLVFVCDTYHHFEYPLNMVDSIWRALRDDGELVVIDFRRVEGESSDWVMGHVRAGQEVFTLEIESMGFELIEEIDLLEQNYMLRFRKTSAP